MNIVYYLLSYGANELNKFQTFPLSFSIYMYLCNWVMHIIYSTFKKENKHVHPKPFNKFASSFKKIIVLKKRFSKNVSTIQKSSPLKL
jgi:uncharacterized membrane protein